MFYSHNKKAKAYIGNIKAKKAYIGTQQVYSAGNIVTYYVDVNIAPIIKEIDSGASCLTPGFTPTKSGCTFTGWRRDNMPSKDVETNLVMGDEPIDLYAVFEQDVTLTTVVSGNAVPHTKKSYYNNNNWAYALFTIPDPTLDGATFKGWTWDGVNIAHEHIIDLPVTENVTRYAVFEYSDITLKSGAWTCGAAGASIAINASAYGSITFSNYSIFRTNSDGTCYVRLAGTNIASVTGNGEGFTDNYEHGLNKTWTISATSGTVYLELVMGGSGDYMGLEYLGEESKIVAHGKTVVG